MSHSTSGVFHIDTRCILYINILVHPSIRLTRSVAQVYTLQDRIRGAKIMFRGSSEAYNERRMHALTAALFSDDKYVRYRKISWHTFRAPGDPNHRVSSFEVYMHCLEVQLQ